MIDAKGCVKSRTCNVVDGNTADCRPNKAVSRRTAFSSSDLARSEDLVQLETVRFGCRAQKALPSGMLIAIQGSPSLPHCKITASAHVSMHSIKMCLGFGRNYRRLVHAGLSSGVFPQCLKFLVVGVGRKITN